MRVIEVFYRVKNKEGQVLGTTSDELTALHHAMANDGTYETVTIKEEVTTHTMLGVEDGVSA